MLKPRLPAFPPGMTLGIAAAAAAAVYAILTIVEAPVWARVLGAVCVLVTGVGVVVEKWRSEQRAKSEVEKDKNMLQSEQVQKWLCAVRECVIWEPPSLHDVDPVRDLSVVRSELASKYIARGEHLSVYVPRDIDAVAVKELQAQGALLLIGTPSSGVTRSALQAALTAPSSSVAIVPLTPAGLIRAFGELDIISRIEKKNSRLVIWLDQIDSYTSAGLNVSIIRHCRERFPGLRIVATISSLKYESWASEYRAVADIFINPIVVERLPSLDELQRASLLYPDEDFGDGIATAFTVTGRLLRRLKGGNTSCPHEPQMVDCAISRGLVQLINEWAQTDIRRDLSMAQLSTLLEQRCGHRQSLGQSHIDAALEWATKPIIGKAALVKIDTDGGQSRMAVHPVLVEIGRAESDGPSADVWAAAQDQARMAKDCETVGRVGFSAHAHGKTEIAARSWADIHTLEPSAVEYMERAAVVSRNAGDFIGAVAPLERLLELTVLEFGQQSIQAAEITKELAATLADAGQLQCAHDFFLSILETFESILGANDQRLVPILRRLGSSYSELLQPEEGMKALERAQAINGSDKPNDMAEAAHILNHMGIVHLKLGEYEKSRVAFLRALQIAEREGMKRSFIGYIMDHLGQVYVELGAVDEGLKTQKRALSIVEEDLGKRHFKVAAVLSNIGRTLMLYQRPLEARDSLERAFGILSVNSGSDPVFAMRVLTNLGNAWQASGDSAKAIELHEQAVLFFGQERNTFSDLGTALFALGNSWSGFGDEEKAAEAFLKALPILESAHGENNTAVALCVLNLGNSFSRRGESEVAIDYHLRAIKILRELYPHNHPLVQQAMFVVRTNHPDSTAFHERFDAKLF